MAVNELTEYLKTAFEYKNSGKYKDAIDFFYKALALDNDSIEILKELAFLYSKLYKYERSIGLYEQIISKDIDNKEAKYNLAELYRIKKDFEKSENLFLELYNSDYRIDDCAENLFEKYSDNQKWSKITELFNQHANTIKSSKAIYYVGFAYFQTGNKQTAMEYFEKAYDIDEKNVKAGLKTAEYLLLNGNITEAENIALKLLKYGENDEIYSLLSEIAYQKSDIDTAVKYGSYSVKINPNNAEGYFKLGILFSLKGFNREAEECYCRAIAIEPNNNTYNYALAYLYYVMKKNELAEKLTDIILDSDSNDTGAISLKALILTDEEKLSEAKPLINKLEQEDIKDDAVYYVLSKYYSKLNIYEKSIEYIKSAIKYNNESIEYKYMLAKLYYKSDKLSESKNMCKEIEEKKSKYIQALTLLAKIYYKEHNYNEAETYVEKVLKLDKNIPEIYYILANMKYEQKNYEKAIENYKIAISMNPAEKITYEKIARGYYEIGNYAEAYLYFKEASDFDVSNPKYRYYMAKCCAENNDIDGAISNFSIVKRLSPSNVDYIKEYADYMYSIGKKIIARNILTALIKRVEEPFQKELKAHLKSYK